LLTQALFNFIEEIARNKIDVVEFAYYGYLNIFPVKDLVLYIAELYLMHELLMKFKRHNVAIN
jgi:hypothetical protein